MAIIKKEFTIGSYAGHFTYDDERSWTLVDEALERVYLTVIEKEVNQDTMIYDGLKEYSPIRDQIKAVRDFLMLAKDLAKDARDEADYYMDSLTSTEEYSKDAMTEKIDLATKALEEYHAKLTGLAPEINRLSAFLSNYNVLDEDYAIWDVFSAITCEHSHDYEVNSIDTMSFNDEDERFRAYVSVKSTSGGNVYRLLDGFITDYNYLMLETEMQYQLWQEFGKRVDLLNKMVRVKVSPLTTDDLNLN